ncbi:MAG: DUF2935 domain-containing protein [Clostridia bacterium]|nr:DUF2935 domain-containing protein [Clostridia bacterium]
MPSQREYIMQSLELHLFFARIMKEHSLFLEAAFTPPNAALAQKAERFKVQFEDLLAAVVRLSNGVVRQQILNSGEVVTSFTLNAERQTSRFTGIGINTAITEAELKLQGNGGEVDAQLYRRITELNRTAIQLLNGLIDFKEHILDNVRSCRMFTMNYPLLIEHILREAKLYRSYVVALQNGMLNDRFMRDTEQFWNRIMMEHAMFIRGLLDPSENELIDASDTFAKEYEQLLKQAQRRNDLASSDLTAASLSETLRFRDFKQAGNVGIQRCEIESIILPLLADHVLREANHYIRLLEAKN